MPLFRLGVFGRFRAGLIIQCRHPLSDLSYQPRSRACCTKSEAMHLVLQRPTSYRQDSPEDHREIELSRCLVSPHDANTPEPNLGTDLISILFHSISTVYPPTAIEITKAPTLGQVYLIPFQYLSAQSSCRSTAASSPAFAGVRPLFPTLNRTYAFGLGFVNGGSDFQVWGFGVGPELQALSALVGLGSFNQCWGHHGAGRLQA